MKQKKDDEIEEKLKYIGLDLNNVPDSLMNLEPINYRATSRYEEKKYRQYRYIPIKDIQILITQANRLDTVEKKYANASSLYSYLVPDTEENAIKHAIFLKMLQKVKIEEIENIEKEQKELNSKIPFNVKYPGNYLWQIYYSELTDKYFMMVPTEDADYSTFFFLLKKQLQKRVIGKVYVPISNIEYSKGIYLKKEIEDIEKYLWLFNKDWPSIYEVHDKTDSISIQIVGETEVYDGIKTEFKVVLKNKDEADKFLKLIKALFILQTELPNYFKFDTNIDKSAELIFTYNGKQMKYNLLVDFITEEYVKVLKNSKSKDNEIVELQQKLNDLKQQASRLQIEYLAKEKQISTFLECKKTFFGKVKYFIKYGKKSKNIANEKVEKDEEENNEIIQNVNIEENVVEEEKKYTLEELVSKYKEYQEKENNVKNIVMDINALKLKIKNITKKIENATQYIEEIDKHKRSIFEFWKYANKDELQSLPEGEKEVINVVPNIKKTFNFENDFEKFAEEMDTIQRKTLNKEELDSIFVTSTRVLDDVNVILDANENSKKELEAGLKRLKQDVQDIGEKDQEFDIFGGLVEDNRRINLIANKKHREIKKDIYNILQIKKDTKALEYKSEIDNVILNIKNAISKIKTNQEIVAYYASSTEINLNNINLFDLNIENVISEITNMDDDVNLYKVVLPRESNIIAFTNSMFYDNQNKTLPIGMDLSTKILLYNSEIKIPKKANRIINIVSREDNNNELSKIKIKKISIYE